MTNKHFYNYLVQLADNAHLLGHRLGEWCGHGPVLEQDIAMTNIALDLIGQSRSLYQYAAQIEGKERTEDDIAFMRDPMDYRNVLLVEQPNRDFAFTIVRQFFYDAYNYFLYKNLLQSKDEHLRAIAEKSIKEITYHLRYSSEWVIRLGDGTDVSHEKMQTAINELWTYTGEMLVPNDTEKAIAEQGFGPDPVSLKPHWEKTVKDTFSEATLQMPENGWMQSGGKDGVHTEHLGFILSEMQYLQRTYPGLEW